MKMKKIIRKIASVVLMGAMVMGLAGCGSSKKASEMSFDIDSFVAAAEKSLDWNDMEIRTEGMMVVDGPLGQPSTFDFVGGAYKCYCAGDFQICEFADKATADECFKVSYDKYSEYEGYEMVYNKGENGYLYATDEAYGYYAFYYTDKYVISLMCSTPPAAEAAHTLLEEMGLPN